MRAIQVQTQQPGHPLIWQETSEPAFGPDEVLVEVHATSVNRADLFQRAGNYPPPPGASDILGLDMAGRIAAVGSQVVGWQVGDNVCALLPGGGYAEKVAVPQSMLMPIPHGWSYEQAGAMPEVFLTAFVNLFLEADFKEGEVVLVHGGSSGVGTAAIQLIGQAGGQVLTTAGTPDKVAFCRNLGANLAVNYRQEDFVEQALVHTNGQGVDIILDMVGADYLTRNIRLLKIRGRLVFISMLSGSRTEIDLGSLMGRRLRLIGSVLRSRSLAEKSEIRKRFMDRFWSQLESGSIQPVIDSVYPIQEANTAHARLEAYQNIGKIVLKVR